MFIEKKTDNKRPTPKGSHNGAFTTFYKHVIPLGSKFESDAQTMGIALIFDKHILHLTF